MSLAKERYKTKALKMWIWHRKGKCLCFYNKASAGIFRLWRQDSWLRHRACSMR